MLGFYLPNDKKLKIKDYIYKQLKTTYKLKNDKEIEKFLIRKNLVIPKSPVFIKYLYISNDNQSIIFDLEKFAIVNKEGKILDGNKIPNKFTLNEINNTKMNLKIEAYNNIKADKQLEISTITKTYGKVNISLMKFNNPQIRNAYNISTELPISQDNSKGALLGNQEILNILIDNLIDNNKINNFKLKTSETIKELFINNKGKSKWEIF